MKAASTAGDTCKVVAGLQEGAHQERSSPQKKHTTKERTEHTPDKHSPHDPRPGQEDKQTHTSTRAFTRTFYFDRFLGRRPRSWLGPWVGALTDRRKNCSLVTTIQSCQRTSVILSGPLAKAFSLHRIQAFFLVQVTSSTSLVHITQRVIVFAVSLTILWRVEVCSRCRRRRGVRKT